MGKKKKNPFIDQQKQDVEFATGNISDMRLEVKKSLPEAARFTEKNQTKKVKQGGQIY